MQAVLIHRLNAVLVFLLAGLFYALIMLQDTTKRFQLMEADLTLAPQALQVNSLHPLFQVPLLDESGPLFDISPDGQRILAVTPAHSESNSIGLLLNWPALTSKK